MITVMLTVPLVYVLTAVHRIHEAALLVESVSANLAQGIARGELTADDAPRLGSLAAHGDGDRFALAVAVDCSAGGCHEPDGRVGVTVRTSVDLPLFDTAGLHTVSARHVEVVDRYARWPS